MPRPNYKLPKILAEVFCALLLCWISLMSSTLHAQNGITAIEATSITSISTTDTLWADSTDERWKASVHGFGPFDIAFWPCGATQGGIPYATSTSHGILQEGCTVSGNAGSFLTGGGSTTPAWSQTPTLGVTGSQTGSITFASVTGTGAYTVTAPSNTATPTLTLPTTTGTLASSATAPISLDSTTGAIACSTCATTSASNTFTGANNTFKRVASSATALSCSNITFQSYGTGASCTSVAGDDTAMHIVVATGTSPGASSGFTVTFADGAWSNSPVCIPEMADSGTAGYQNIKHSTTTTTMVVTHAGTPVASTTYTFDAICVGKQN